jgi:transposase
MGRPTSLTPEVEKAIVLALRAGNYRDTAAQAAGIHRHTLRNWVIRGEQDEEPFASFLAALEKAEAAGEKKLLREIRKGVDGWQSRAWMLERRWPSRWSGRVRLTVSDHVDQLTSKLKADPELHRKVLDVLAGEEPAPGEQAH